MTNEEFCQYKSHKTGVINDPLGQTLSFASRDHYFHLKRKLRISERTCMKILITTGCDGGMIEWINN